MKKITKYFFLFCPITIYICPLTSSCSNNNALSKDIYSFLYDRTFSISWSKNGHGWFGTGWLIKHISGTGLSNYSYDMMTNWHVRLSQEQLNAPVEKRWWFSDSQEFGSNANVMGIFSSFEYSGSACYDIIDGRKLGVDACVATVDFGNSGPKLTKRLDRVNEYADNHNSFCVQIANSPLKPKDYIWMCGYPLYNWNQDEYVGPKWYGGNDYISEKNSHFQAKTNNHGIDDANPPTIISIADLYELPWHKTKESQPLFNMSGGASGSIVVNKNMEVIGLYWGGYIQIQGGAYQAYQCAIDSFIDFSSSGNQYNLFSDFEHGKWQS